MNVISLQNIEKSYGTRLLFKEVNITFTTENDWASWASTAQGNLRS